MEFPIYTEKKPERLRLPKPLLGYYLVIKTNYGDFKTYFNRFNHQNANISRIWYWKKISPKYPVYYRYLWTV